MTARIAGQALPPELAHLAEGLLGEALAKAVEYAQHSASPTTETIYDDDWATFRAWCLEHQAPYLPALPSVVAAYLAHRAGTLGGRGLRLRLILAAVAFHHRRAGHLFSSADPVIATVMRGIPSDAETLLPKLRDAHRSEALVLIDFEGSANQAMYGGPPFLADPNGGAEKCRGAS